jgi:hypothetical protein
MRTAFLSFIFIMASIIGDAQIVIRGKVVDSSDLPIANANIYLNRTSFGSSSNNAGEFIIEANGIYSGELIVSATGYECLSYKLDITNTTNKLYKFKLVKKKPVNNILQQPDMKRKNWLAAFKRTLLGITEEANNCIIENLASVYFVQGEDSNITYAYADTPLVIINKLLGYEITYDLIEFSEDKKTGSYFLGYCRYRETGDKKKWAKRRLQNYHGSTMHFYRSLINKDLYEQGFSMFEVKMPKGSAGGRQNLNFAFIIDPATVAPIEAVKILFIDSISNEYYLHFSNTIIVEYNKRPRSVDYLSTIGFVQGLNNKGFTAYISLLTDKAGIDINGVIDEPESIMYNGFWVYEKLANQLPYNYQPN